MTVMDAGLDYDLGEQVEYDDVEETEEEANEEAKEEETDASVGEPEDLAAALRAVQQADKESAAAPVADRGSAEDVGAGEPEPEGEEGEAENEVDLQDDSGDPDAGGPGDADGAADYESTERALIGQLNQYALSVAAQEFRKQGIREMTMNDIYERTSDGRVVYHNPDDQGRPFSSRMEAQAWLDSFNGQVKTELRRRANEVRGQAAKQLEPSIRLLRFAPKYDAMSDEEREIFDDLTSYYEVRNAQGKVIGYSCDLERMASQAHKMALKYSRPRARKAPAASGKTGPQRKPAVDMQSHGTAKTEKPGDSEPRNLEEAMRMFNEMNKKNRSN